MLLSIKTCTTLVIVSRFFFVCISALDHPATWLGLRLQRAFFWEPRLGEPATKLLPRKLSGQPRGWSFPTSALFPYYVGLARGSGVSRSDGGQLQKAFLLGNRAFVHEVSAAGRLTRVRLRRDCRAMPAQANVANKSSLEEIQARFDRDVERFSNLETGQQATIDAPLVLELIAATAAKILSEPVSLLDLGCGAGNLTLKVLQKMPGLECHLVDLSQPMLERARQRVGQETAARIATYQQDMRTLTFPDNVFDLIVAGAVLHHLRDDSDWEDFFGKLHLWLKPSGALFVADLVAFDHPGVQKVMWERYGEYLKSLRDEEYRDQVFAYIDAEDSPRSLTYQLELLRQNGFTTFDVLHRNSVFACYYGVK
jgi:tRNA (cmo5U34)-methyltransferase